MDRAARMVGTQLTKMQWAIGLSGVLAVVFGVMVLAWPGISLYALTILFGAYALARGVVGLVSALSGGGWGERGWLVVSSLLGIAAGVVVLVWPSISALALIYVIGAYALALGVMAIVAGFWLPVSGGDTALMVLSGLVFILFGIVIFARPGAGALVTLGLIAAFALISGVTEIVVAIGGKRLLVREAGRIAGWEPKAS